jgi:hypothetical protein
MSKSIRSARYMHWIYVQPAARVPGAGRVTPARVSFRMMLRIIFLFRPWCRSVRLCAFAVVRLRVAAL